MRAFVPLLALGSLACAQAASPGSSTAPTVAAAPPAFELRTVERTAGDCSADEAPCAHFLARYPVLTGGVLPGALEAVNRSIREMVAAGGGVLQEGAEGSEETAVPATVEVAADRFLADWAEARGEFPEDAPAAYHRWSDERKMAVIHADPRVLSVELTLYAYTGGAHPNTFVELESFDLTTGEPLGLPDLLAADAGPRLEELGERLFRREREIAEGESLEETGFWFEDDRFHLTDNFAVTGEGLLFVYNPYEVAPYVFGPTRITVPWSELRELLLPGAPVLASATVGA